VVEPDNDGDPCPEQSETLQCNVAACNADCVLNDWADWGLCSKACEGGHETRTRSVSEEKRGNGECAHPEAEPRMEHKECNAFDCSLIIPADANRTLLQCPSMIDLVIMLDGSGSLGENGWQMFKSSSRRLISAMTAGNTSGINIGFMLFSGPSTGPDLETCTSSDPLAKPDVEVQCGIKWIHHLSTDIPEVEQKVSELEWPARTTLTSMAIAEAKAELINGRQDASSVVVIITDGKPMSPIKTGQASLDLKSDARLIWIPVGGGAQEAVEEMKVWASKPWQDNLLPIQTFADLASPTTLNNIISTICPLVA
jgi:hypothetical protein